MRARPTRPDRDAAVDAVGLIPHLSGCLGMKRRILPVALCSLLTSPVFASTWHFVWVGNDEVRFFFDGDTVERNREITTVWIKTVRTNQADGDGSWASALRWRMNCSKRTIQTLAWSSYAKDGKFLKSNSNPAPEEPTIPDSTGEAILKIACEANFPRDTSGEKYFKLEGNDVFQATKNFVEYRKTQMDVAPK